MRPAEFLLKVGARLLVLAVFWTPISSAVIAAIFGSLLKDVLSIAALLSGAGISAVSSLITLVTSVLALMTALTSSYKLYVATSVAFLVSAEPTPTQITLIIIGLACMLLIDAYLTEAVHKAVPEMTVGGSKVYFIITVATVFILAVCAAYLVTSYIDGPAGI